MENQEVGRHLDLVAKLKLKKLEKEVIDSENQVAKELLGVIEKLNKVIDTKETEYSESRWDHETEYGYRPFE